MMLCTVGSSTVATWRCPLPPALVDKERLCVRTQLCLLLQVGVHIADVSHFIRPGNALDGEAANRGTTVYLCGRVSP